MLRTILGVVAGTVSQMLVTMLVQASILLTGYKMPEGLDVKNKAQMTEYINGLPLWLLLTPLVSYLLAGIVGVWVALWIVQGRRIAGVIVALILAGFCVINLLTIAHPMWFMAANVVVVVVAWFIGDRLGRKRA